MMWKVLDAGEGQEGRARPRAINKCLAVLSHGPAHPPFCRLWLPHCRASSRSGRSAGLGTTSPARTS